MTADDAVGEPAVLTTHQDGVLTLLLNRPRTRNSLVLESWHAMDAALDQVDTASVHCVLLYGEGGYFSSGGDLRSTPHSGNDALAPVGRLKAAHRVIKRLQALPVPVIAAVEGGAAGLGWSLVLACDFVVTGGSARFSAPFVARGVVPDGGAAWHLTRRLGRARAAALLLAGDSLTAGEAFEAGLVTQVVEAGSALEQARATAARLRTGYPHAMQLTKELLTAADQLDLEQYLDREVITAAYAQTGGEAARARELFGAIPRAQGTGE